MDKKSYIKPSEFYWGIGMILSLTSLSIYYSSNGLLRYFIFSLLFLVMSLFINHSKKIRKMIDYERVKGGNK
jgi:hypothetical protein